MRNDCGAPGAGRTHDLRFRKSERSESSTEVRPSGGQILGRSLMGAVMLVCGACLGEVTKGVETDLSPTCGDDPTIYCDGAVDCPPDTASVATWWCQPVRDEPNPDGRWGVCRPY